MELPAEIAGIPARLQFQFAGHALPREECALVNAREIAQIGVTIGQLHGGREQPSVDVFAPLWRQKNIGRDAAAASFDEPYLAGERRSAASLPRYARPAPVPMPRPPVQANSVVAANVPRSARPLPRAIA